MKHFTSKLTGTRTMVKSIPVKEKNTTLFKERNSLLTHNFLPRATFMDVYHIFHQNSLIVIGKTRNLNT